LVRFLLLLLACCPLPLPLPLLLPLLQAGYRGGGEERADLLRHYQQFKGRMVRVFEWVMLSEPDKDSHRFMDALEAAIAAGAHRRPCNGGRRTQGAAWGLNNVQQLPCTKLMAPDGRPGVLHAADMACFLAAALSANGRLWCVLCTSRLGP
jgi:hypothetical protein